MLAHLKTTGPLGRNSLTPVAPPSERFEDIAQAPRPWLAAIHALGGHTSNA